MAEIWSKGRLLLGTPSDTIGGNGDALEPVNEIRGFGDLLALTVARVTAPVEGMHRAIAHRWLGWTGWAGVPGWRMYDTLVAETYEAIRLTGSMLGTAVGLGATIAGGNEKLRVFSQSRTGSRVQAAINAVWGDELERSRNELRVEMGPRDFRGTQSTSILLIRPGACRRIPPEWSCLSTGSGRRSDAGWEMAPVQRQR